MIKITPEIVELVVSRTRGIDIKDKSRTAPYIKARWVYVLLTDKYTKATNAAKATAIERTHASVLGARNKAINKQYFTPDCQLMLEQCEKHLIKEYNINAHHYRLSQEEIERRDKTQVIAFYEKEFKKLESSKRTLQRELKSANSKLKSRRARVKLLERKVAHLKDRNFNLILKQ